MDRRDDVIDTYNEKIGFVNGLVVGFSSNDEMENYLAYCESPTGTYVSLAERRQRELIAQGARFCWGCRAFQLSFFERDDHFCKSCEERIVDYYNKEDNSRFLVKLTAYLRDPSNNLPPPRGVSEKPFIFLLSNAAATVRNNKANDLRLFQKTLFNNGNPAKIEVLRTYIKANYDVGRFVFLVEPVLNEFLALFSRQYRKEEAERLRKLEEQQQKEQEELEKQRIEDAVRRACIERSSIPPEQQFIKAFLDVVTSMKKKEPLLPPNNNNHAIAADTTTNYANLVHDFCHSYAPFESPSPQATVEEEEWKYLCRQLYYNRNYGPVDCVNILHQVAGYLPHGLREMRVSVSIGYDGTPNPPRSRKDPEPPRFRTLRNFSQRFNRRHHFITIGGNADAVIPVGGAFASISGLFKYNSDTKSMVAIDTKYERYLFPQLSNFEVCIFKWNEHFVLLHTGKNRIQVFTNGNNDDSSTIMDGGGYGILCFRVSETSSITINCGMASDPESIITGRLKMDVYRRSHDQFTTCSLSYCKKQAFHLIAPSHPVVATYTTIVLDFV